MQDGPRPRDPRRGVGRADPGVLHCGSLAGDGQPLGRRRPGDGRFDGTILSEPLSSTSLSSSSAERSPGLDVATAEMECAVLLGGIRNAWGKELVVLHSRDSCKQIDTSSY